MLKNRIVGVASSNIMNEAVDQASFNDCMIHEEESDNFLFQESDQDYFFRNENKSEYYFGDNTQRRSHSP